MIRLLLLLILIPFCGFSQDPLTIFPLVNGKIAYTEVVSSDSVGHKELYRRLKKWVVDNFASAKAVTEIDDAENGVFAGNAVMYFYTSAGEKIPLHFALRIECKDNRYRYNFNSFRVKYSGYSQYGGSYDVDSPLEQWKPLIGRKQSYVQVNDEMISTVKSLKSAMTVKSFVQDNSW